MTDTLDRIIYGKATDTDQITPLALSTAFTPEDAELWRSLVFLAPAPPSTTQPSSPVGIFAGPGRDFLLATLRPADDESEASQSEIILLPRKLLQLAAGNVEPLVELMLEQPVSSSNNGIMPPVEVPVIVPWPEEDRLQRFRDFYHDYAQGDIEQVMRLLAAALDKKRLLICGYEGSTAERVALVQGLMALLPACARPEMTFSTLIDEAAPASLVLAFAGEIVDEQRWLANSSEDQFPEIEFGENTYVALLHDLWQGDEQAFIQGLTELDAQAELLVKGANFEAGLNNLAAQYRLDQSVRKGDPVPPEDLKAALINDTPLDPELTRRYAELLLQHALDSRDTEAALLVALKMDEDEALDETLSKMLNEALQSQPDSVYVLVRTRLNDAMEADSRWIERLQSAALVSLQVAINDADSETMVNWLRLIAREPASYGLTEILHEGIIAAQRRAREDGELARHLIILALKHAPDTVDTLIADEKLLAVLPDNVGLVLRDHAGDPLLALNRRGPEFFLVAVAQAAKARAADFFSSEVIDQIWRFYTSAGSIDLPEHYQPQHIIEMLTTGGPEWLPEAALSYLGTLQLADNQDELFQTFARNLANNDRLEPVLPVALQSSQRGVEDIGQLLNHVANANYLPPQTIYNIYVELLDQREWRQAAMPLIEQLARYIQQNLSLTTDISTLWRLMEAAAAARSEVVARAATQKLFISLETDEENENDEQLIENLMHINESLQWSSTTRQNMLRWWRDFVRQQPIARLARLEKLLEGKKSLVNAQSIVHSALAFRRMLGKRSVEEFAEAINTIYSILQDLSESFDPTPRQPTSFDEETIRAELDAHRDALSDHKWRILAKNFRELAALIGTMGDHRSKGSLVRQNVDRQLLAGEQQPESAVDTLKWMAGYLEGIQDRDVDDSE